MRQFSVQCAPIRLYLEDGAVDDTEDFFTKQKKPMVPMKYVLTLPEAESSNSTSKQMSK